MFSQLPIALPPHLSALYLAAKPSSDLLAEAISVETTPTRVVLLGCAADPVGLWLASRHPDTACVSADDNAAHVNDLATLARKAGLGNVRALDPAELADGLRAGQIAPFDLAVCDTLYHESKRMTFALMALAAAALRAGGTLLVSGAKSRGILSITDEVKRTFGNVSVVRLGKGHRVVSARRDSSSDREATWPDPSSAKAQRVTIRGIPLTLVVAPLVFAEGGVDAAARMLAESMDLRPDDVVVDLGCGAGVVGLVAGQIAPHGHVYLVDASRLAARTARENARRNALTNTTAVAGDAETVMVERSLRPSVIVSNPPHHSGQMEATGLAERFIAASARQLTPGGRLYVVANRFLPYERLMRPRFAEVREVAGDTRYKVLLGTGSLSAPTGSRS